MTTIQSLIDNFGAQKDKLESVLTNKDLLSVFGIDLASVTNNFKLSESPSKTPIDQSKTVVANLQDATQKDVIAISDLADALINSKDGIFNQFITKSQIIGAAKTYASGKGITTDPTSVANMTSLMDGVYEKGKTDAGGEVNAYSYTVDVSENAEVSVQPTAGQPGYISGKTNYFSSVTITNNAYTELQDAIAQLAAI